MDQDDKKNLVAEAALDYIQSGDILGIGSGSTVNKFINLLGSVKNKIEACVSSSQKSTELLHKMKIPVIDLKECDRIPLYIDGADEANSHKELIKGGGGALTREKILAQSSEKFICIIDESKVVDKLGKFPLPIEVIQLAQSKISLEMIKIGGRPVYRNQFITDNGHIIIDVHDLDINEPMALEKKINHMPGVITNGIFSIRSADEILIATDSGVIKR
ncbi:MAG: ribose 5-phosphate isomerase A [Gammaproteobacteria bacterium]|jgi:ribose 5-phosphate isomerase A|nr:ribose 5-phosphate isomerase A [Gammaproteobacteria bacterium]|tara:strand:- start:1901 stop:2554 length:654 start_codon:yes stop_codon:yes gene_type:complete